MFLSFKNNYLYLHRNKTDDDMNIKKKIKECGWTVSKLAEELGIKQASLSTIINGDNPSYQTLKKIADKLGISVSELVREEEEPTIISCPICGGTFSLEVKPKSRADNRKQA